MEVKPNGGIILGATRLPCKICFQEVKKWYINICLTGSAREMIENPNIVRYPRAEIDHLLKLARDVSL